jgi:hypothetical protein
MTKPIRKAKRSARSNPIHITRRIRGSAAHLLLSQTRRAFGVLGLPLRLHT